ncbi:response regulator [Candidatus Woesearchaeota archaeon]|nr:response regulator [Candidatus Woesearchaeota archaeon]
MKKKVLIVDDEEDILTSVAMLINDMGYEAKTVNNGKKALEMLKKQKFDLVLLDILMPDMSGREVLEKIREDPKLKNQKAAFLTVVKLSEYGRGIMKKKLKPVDYFQKPINVSDFRRRIKKILE